MKILEYTPEHLESFKDLIAELQDSLKSIDPDVVAAGDRVRDVYGDELLENVRKNSGQIYIAQELNKTVGFVAAYVDRNTDEAVDFLYISDLSVTESERGRGIGKLLLKRIEDYARERGLRYMRIGSLVANEGAARLYRNMGFSDYLMILQKKV